MLFATILKLSWEFFVDINLIFSSLAYIFSGLSQQPVLLINPAAGPGTVDEPLSRKNKI